MKIRKEVPEYTTHFLFTLLVNLQFEVVPEPQRRLVSNSNETRLSIVVARG